jgi:Tol biopolymer transport system component
MTARMALASGTQVGPYTVAGPLGAGGMGEVYRARDERLGRDVALKLLPASAVANADRLQRFEQEARATAALNHPNILALYDIGRSEHGPYLVTELLEGETLRAALERGAMPVRKALDAAAQIARGLAAAHERGIVHRDLKPDNVFVTPAGHVKILDFGLVKLTEAAPSGSAVGELATAAPATSPGIVLGTIGYMAPEQVLARPTDHRADIFALGVLLYELLTGKRAFARETAPETMTAILKEEPPALMSDGVVPPALQRIVSRCLEKNPSARFQSAEDLAFALETLSPGSGATTPQTQAVATPPARRPWRLAWLVAPLGVLLGAAGMWLVAPPPTPDARVTRFEVSAPDSWGTDLGGGLVPLALSPDGRSLAGNAINDKGETALFVRAFDTLESRIVAGTEGASSFFWSPDGHSLAFFVGSQLKRVDIAGGAAIVICEASTADRGGVWTSNGVIVFGSTLGLQQVPATGGTPTTALALAPDEAFHSAPLLLPDGQRVLVVAGVGSAVRGGARRRVVATRLGSTERTVLFDIDQFVHPVGFAEGHLIFVRGTSLLAQPFDAATLRQTGDPVPLVDRVELIRNTPYGFASVTGSAVAFVPPTNPNVHQLTWFDRAGRETALLGEPGNYSSLELSPDQSHAAVAVMDSARRNHDIWVYDVTRALRTRFTFEPGDERTAVWSPASDRLFLNRQQKDTERDLFVKAADGSGREAPVVVNGLSKDAMSVSPDGRWLLYRESSKRFSDIWIAPLSSGGKPVPFIATEFDENYARFSPDGRWVVYASLESGRWEVYVVPFPGPGGKWQVSTAGGDLPRWRGDGREIFYLALDGNLMSVAVDGRSAAFQVGQASALFRPRIPSPVGYNYAVSADGQRFLVNVSAESASPVAIIDGWPALVKK